MEEVERRYILRVLEAVGGNKTLAAQILGFDRKTLYRFDDIVVEDLPEKIRTYHHSHVVVAGEDPSELVSMEELERRYIQRVLEAAGGNKTLAARILGFDRTTLYRKLDRYGLGGDSR